MKRLRIIAVTCLTLALGLAVACGGGPPDKAAVTSRSPTRPAPLSSIPLLSTAEAGPTPAEKPAPSDSPKPPSADLIIGEQRQKAGQGGYCWSDESGRPSCRSMFGVPTALEPLSAESPFTAYFLLSAREAPSELRLEINPVEADDQRDAKDRDVRRWWRPRGMLGEPLALPPKRETSVDLSLEPGLYVFQVFGRWPGLGDALYGFLVEVR